jgi:endogenous inhibitor of DNA gyrase (YacG/DUF329 family)
MKILENALEILNLIPKNRQKQCSFCGYAFQGTQYSVCEHHAKKINQKNWNGKKIIKEFKKHTQKLAQKGKVGKNYCAICGNNAQKSTTNPQYYYCCPNCGKIS